MMHLFVGCSVMHIMLVQVVGVCSNDALGLVTSLGADALDYTDPATKDVLRTDGRFDLVINAAGADDLDYLDALRPWMGSSFVTLSPPLLRNIDSDGMILGLLKSVKEVVCRNTSSLSEGRAYKWAFYMPNPWALNQITKMLSTYKVRYLTDSI
ncbi:Reticulon-4-interacting protein 1, mitochondrial [Portunus trituberculatus]|uniref:Reticulon-4-interacting protein 1, mitochondrial n=1 Tax=Portunus trituberculatus TaxID=210409 RepID=A0A5B7GFZ8_PORTR|nr:Reticulon-4-interacting protein 1, mitochondrial [Portunus trituberculatus]